MKADKASLRSLELDLTLSLLSVLNAITEMNIEEIKTHIEENE